MKASVRAGGGVRLSLNLSRQQAPSRPHQARHQLHNQLCPAHSMRVKRYRRPCLRPPRQGMDKRKSRQASNPLFNNVFKGNSMLVSVFIGSGVVVKVVYTLSVAERGWGCGRIRGGSLTNLVLEGTAANRSRTLYRTVACALLSYSAHAKVSTLPAYLWCLGLLGLFPFEINEPYHQYKT